MTSDHIHVRIDHAIDLRKSLLEAALMSTEMLHTLEEYREFQQMSEMFRKQAVKMTGTMVKDAQKLGKWLPELPEDFAGSKTVEEEQPELMGTETEKYKIQDEIMKIRIKLKQLRSS